MTSIDMRQFHGTFLEESVEHLDEIEHLLMSFDSATQDAEILNCIFRAAHSIKGGAGIFGFDALISVTHLMENLFDLARKDKFQLTTSVINDLLSVVDVLRQLIQGYSQEEPVNWSIVAQATTKIEALLNPEADDSDGFGFFAAVADEKPDEDGFGLFESAVPASPPDDDDGFGFFDSDSAAVGADVTKNERPEQQTSDDVMVRSAPQSPPTPEKKPATPSQAAAATSSRAKTESESSSIRVDLQKIDGLVNLVGELVITQSMLSLIGEEIEGAVTEKLQIALAELERNTRDLQEGIMSIRMLPMSFVFNRFPRVVRDLSQKLNKTVELQIEGGHTEIDKGLIEKLVDPLTHLVRNSLDHGIELPAARQSAGKSSLGVLLLKAEQKGGNVLITVKDDGGGLDRQRILAKARESGLDISDTAADEDVWQLIMAPGFSTAAEVTDVSGRGVGMDVVKRNIEAMGGNISIQSQRGRGTSIQIRLPLTLAILDGMIISVSGQKYIVPLVNIVESIQPNESNLTSISNRQMLYLRDSYWPLVPLHQVMGLEANGRKITEGILVLVEASQSRFAILVDDLIGQQQVVIKSLEQHYRRVPGIAGATIMGDGGVALILDVESMQQHLAGTVIS
jgi:two-component system, chemotaxis family, sensor kinase CheA